MTFNTERSCSRPRFERLLHTLAIAGVPRANGFCLRLPVEVCNIAGVKKSPDAHRVTSRTRLLDTVLQVPEESEDKEGIEVQAVLKEELNPPH
eukprot:CAMPEP_0185770414 /NCGR_PEP_ID=MMETSP1174-20130828/59027_1 /TAXON_ID=35687 /ORGANISM="Dictyocha speculum, Strain CCMP1381" /LENGTH=92 /DNA_ID=CAMNT_0028455837 /DNA_START=203 /DNA_END=479 /DNA_ORIENTATION=+